MEDLEDDFYLVSGMLEGIPGYLRTEIEEALGALERLALAAGLTFYD